MDESSEVSSSNSKTAMKMQCGVQSYESPGATSLHKYVNVPFS
jgi:hypothetical protein